MYDRFIISRTFAMGHYGYACRARIGNDAFWGGGYEDKVVVGELEVCGEGLVSRADTSDNE